MLQLPVMLSGSKAESMCQGSGSKGTSGISLTVRLGDAHDDVPLDRLAAGRPEGHPLGISLVGCERPMERVSMVHDRVVPGDPIGQAAQVWPLQLLKASLTRLVPMQPVMERQMV